MKHYGYSGFLRLISAVVLCCFTWSFGGVFDVAYAAKISTQLSALKNQHSPFGILHSASSNQQSANGSQEQKEQKPEAKFGKTLDEVGQILSDTATDTVTKKNRLNGKKSDIENLDREIKKQFAATEKKLKSEGLPGEILNRHYEFVNKYESNLKELKNNLDAIAKARDRSEMEEKIERTKTHLEKVRPPKKHTPLDPNKLPHRSAGTVRREPRTSPEQFEKEHGAKKLTQLRKPILIASNGPLTGLLAHTPVFYSQIPDTPTDADLEQTIEVQFTPAIQAKAAELNHNPVKIYNWVRNNIEYVPTYGSIQGADMCLQTKQGNDFDTASLLIALLRASGIPARYAYGSIELPIEKVKNWVGGFTDSMAALDLLAAAGIPVEGITVGGEIKYARLEHAYVEAWIDYIPSRGEIHKKGDTWIPLDASFKQYNYAPGIDIKSAVPFDGQTFMDQLKSTATINEAEGSITNVNPLLVQQTLEDYRIRVEDYISQNYPDATVGDVIGKKEVKKQEYSYLLGTLPYRVIVKGATYTNIPDNLKHKITFNVTKDGYDDLLGTGISITKSLPELAGKKITLSYSPATPQDEATINSFLPKPHTDGTPIQPDELPTSLPAYLINVKPELRIDGVVVATGTSITLGNNETFTMTFSGPDSNAHDVITNPVKAGNYLGIALNLGRVSPDEIMTLKGKLESTKAKLESQDLGTITKDDLVGDLLYSTALAYHAEVGVTDQISAKKMGVVAVTLPSETIFSFDLKSTYVFGIPLSVSPGGLTMDADRLMTLTKALDGDKAKSVRYMLVSGSNSSALEHSVPEKMWSTSEDQAEGISAVKALQIANDQGIPVYAINQSNISTILPRLQVDADVKADIQNAVNVGRIVTVSEREITFHDWTGCGYIIVDPATGAGAYMISGGMNGASLVDIAIMTVLIIMVAALVSAIAVGIAYLIAVPGAVCAAVVAALIAINQMLFQAYTAIMTAKYVGTAITKILEALDLLERICPTPPWEFPWQMELWQWVMYGYILRAFIMKYVWERWLAWIFIEKFHLCVYAKTGKHYVFKT